MNELFLFVLLLITAKAIALSEQPNILLLFPDQWRFDWDGRNNSQVPLNIPRISQLIREGTKFEHAYVPAPVCSPSRSCLVSGREYDHAGVPTNFHNDYDVSIPTFFSALQEAGYWTMTTGKDDLNKATQLGTRIGLGHWNGTYHQKEMGFSDGLRSEGKGDVVDLPVPHEMYGHWLKEQRILLKNGTSISGWDAHYLCMKHFGSGECSSEIYPDRLYEDNWVADNALTLLRRRPKNKPWMLWVSFPGPHPPFLVTTKMETNVANKSFPPAVDNTKSLPETCVPTGKPQSSTIDRCDYAAEMENLDRLFALILDEVEEQEESDNTIVCFASDHGEMLGDHGDEGKTYPWQGSSSVPLVCKGPGIRQGVSLKLPVATMDLAATFIDYGKGKKPSGMTSQSLRTLLEKGEDKQYRGYISSGLQSFAFNETFESATTRMGSQQEVNSKYQKGYSWRMVVESGSNLKLVCCKGKCPGSPGTIPSVRKSGFTIALYDTNADPFDMHPLNANDQHMDDVERLMKFLPSSFGCEL
eukprot:g3640.t1